MLTLVKTSNYHRSINFGKPITNNGIVNNAIKSSNRN